MKKNLQISPLSIILAALFLSLFGGIWYGVLFHDVQVEAHRYTQEDYDSSHPAWYVGGVVISLFIAWGLAMMVRLGNVSGIRGGIKASTRAAVGFGIPLVSYPLVFSPLHDITLYIVGFSQIVIAWTIAGAIIGGMTKESASQDQLKEVNKSDRIITTTKK